MTDRVSFLIPAGGDNTRWSEAGAASLIGQTFLFAGRIARVIAAKVTDDRSAVEVEARIDD